MSPFMILPPWTRIDPSDLGGASFVTFPLSSSRTAAIRDASGTRVHSWGIVLVVEAQADMRISAGRYRVIRRAL
jgi:hypothetical protein